EAVGLAPPIGNIRGGGWGTAILGWVELLESDPERARTKLEEAAAIARRRGVSVLGAEGVWGAAPVAPAEARPGRAAPPAGRRAWRGLRPGCWISRGMTRPRSSRSLVTSTMPA